MRERAAAPANWIPTPTLVEFSNESTVIALERERAAASTRTDE
jgi:hypothetical protein